MITNQITKWIFILCAATLVINGFLYWGLKKNELLYGIYGALGLGTVTGVYLLLKLTKKE